MADGYWEAQEPDAEGWLCASLSGTFVASDDDQDGDEFGGVREPLNPRNAPPSFHAAVEAPPPVVAEGDEQ